jgi:hypothetical protein
MALNASRQLKVLGLLVIGLSGLLLFGAAVGSAVDLEKIIDALLACMALWSRHRDRIVAISALGATVESGLLQSSLHIRSSVSRSHSRSHRHHA